MTTEPRPEPPSVIHLLIAGIAVRNALGVAAGLPRSQVDQLHQPLCGTGSGAVQEHIGLGSRPLIVIPLLITTRDD